MVVLDLLGRRTAMRILWELRNGALNFRALQEACETNSGLLNVRLRELREAGIVELTEHGYDLTPSGKKLRAALAPLGKWATEWADSAK
jgi:DNA-binding HxlR family transcriptional regulator